MIKILRYIFCVPLAFILAFFCGSIIQIVVNIVQSFFCRFMLLKYYGMCEDTAFFAYLITAVLTVQLTFVFAPDKKKLFNFIAIGFLILYNILCLFYDFYSALFVLIGVIVWLILSIKKRALAALF